MAKISNDSKHDQENWEWGTMDSRKEEDVRAGGEETVEGWTRVQPGKQRDKKRGGAHKT